VSEQNKDYRIAQNCEIIDWDRLTAQLLGRDLAPCKADILHCTARYYGCYFE
jgi:hypothetical protein